MSEFTNLLRKLGNEFNLGGGDLRDIPPLVLAYIGDTVYHVYIRTMLIFKSSCKTVNNLHRESVKHVKASAQAAIAKAIINKLDENEKDILRRGRNAHPGTVPKNALVTDYRMATGFEAVIGYLYLSGNMERLEELLDISAGIIGEREDGNSDNGI